MSHFSIYICYQIEIELYCPWTRQGTSVCIVNEVCRWIIEFTQYIIRISLINSRGKSRKSLLPFLLDDFPSMHIKYDRNSISLLANKMREREIWIIFRDNNNRKSEYVKWVFSLKKKLKSNPSYLIEIRKHIQVCAPTHKGMERIWKLTSQSIHILDCCFRNDNSFWCMAFQINHVSDQSLSFINKLTSAISQISYELWEQKVHGFESVCWVSKTNKINVQRWTYQHMMHSHQLKFAIRDSRAIGCY